MENIEKTVTEMIVILGYAHGSISTILETPMEEWEKKLSGLKEFLDSKIGEVFHSLGQYPNSFIKSK